MYFEASKADDVQFILDLIAKVAAEVPAADMDNVNIAGLGQRYNICHFNVNLRRNQQWSRHGL